MDINKEYTAQEYITVFWPINGKKNNFMPTLIKYINAINSINTLDYKNNFDEYNILINSYEEYILSIKHLASCLDILFKQNINDLFNKYEIDFMNKINITYKYLNEITQSNISFDKFCKFMYVSTCEGRIIRQNMIALRLLQQIKNANELVLSLKKKDIKENEILVEAIEIQVEAID